MERCPRKWVMQQGAEVPAAGCVQVVPRWRRSLLPRQTRACKRKTLVRPWCKVHAGYWHAATVHDAFWAWQQPILGCTCEENF